jgi:CheY-like chemotaxis protein
MTTDPDSHISADQRAAVVLHIDDDSNDAELLRAAARRSSVPLNLEHAIDGEQAIDYLRCAESTGECGSRELPALILVDLKLPRIGGLEIVRWVRSHPAMRNIPVVVLSGSELSSDMQRAYDAGADSYVVKPLGFERLVGLVEQLAGSWCRPA